MQSLRFPSPSEDLCFWVPAAIAVMGCVALSGLEVTINHE
jgi:hypothetical protein